MVQHLRHKALSALERSRALVLVCPPFKSKVNLSRIVRLAGCAAVEKVVACGTAKIDPVIARGAEEHVVVEQRRSQIPVIEKLGSAGYRLVGLEQTDSSQSLFDYRFERKTALVIGHERLGIEAEELKRLDDLIEIPVYGLPHSYNVVTATTMAVYEYCKQFPTG